MFERLQVCTDDFRVDFKWVAELPGRGTIVDDATDMRRKVLAVALLSAIGRRDAAVRSMRACRLDARLCVRAMLWERDTQVLFDAHSAAFELTSGREDHEYARMNDSITRWMSARRSSVCDLTDCSLDKE